MTGRFRLARSTAVILALSSGAFAPSSVAAFDLAPDFAFPAFPTLNTSRTVAEAAERAGLWETALEHYLGLYLSAGPSAELRDKIRLCSRHAAQLRRHRDPAFQHFVQTLPAADALNLYADVLAKLSTLYADKDRATPPRLFELGLDELDRAFGDPSFRSIHADPAKVRAFRESLRAGWESRLPPGPKEARQLARDLAAAAHDQAGVTNPSAVVLELLCGACTGLDEYTTYLPPTADHADPTAELAAYGVYVRRDVGGWVIDGVAANSWAALNTTLRKGQRLFPFDADRTASPFGFVVEAAAPDGLSPPELARFPVPAPTAFAADVGTMKDGIGYVRVTSFREDTPRELDEQVLQLRRRGMRGLVLDLRGNPGGLFPAAVDVAQRFLPGGILAAAQGQSPEFAGRVFSSTAGPAAWTFPVVVLVDTRTMSAAEVVAAALKEGGAGGRAKLIGSPTFGKGVVQSSVRLNRTDAADGTGGVLVLTVATLTGPGGNALNGGVIPHVVEADPARQLDRAVRRLNVLIHMSH